MQHHTIPSLCKWQPQQRRSQFVAQILLLCNDWVISSTSYSYQIHFIQLDLRFFWLLQLWYKKDCSQDVVKGHSYLWHEKYSLRSTKVLGFVACRVTSKLCGIGAAERCWGGVKQIKTGKRSHLSSESTEKRSIIFANAKVTQGRVKSDRLQGLDVRGDNVSFGDDDMTI
jgi:hypothetical protein